MVDKIADAVVEKLKERLIAALETSWELFKEALVEFSFIAALYGGAGLIIARVCGSTRATKYFIALQIANLFIQGMLA